MVTMETIKLTKDMIGDLFMTRVGKVVQMAEWHIEGHEYQAEFSDSTFRTIDGEYYKTLPSGRDLIKHLPKSEYPEYYL